MTTKRKEHPEDSSRITFDDHCFEECVRLDRDLAALRKKYADAPAEDRRMAAQWAYDESIAGGLFGRALAAAGHDPFPFGRPRWPDGVVALAIDPLCAPALLTVGAHEYQLGRKEKGMALFLRLTTLPPDEPDLPQIIDKAGDFLIDEKDYERALTLYLAAEKAYPDVALYCVGATYCLGKLGRYEEAVAKARRADELEPDDPEHLNDLGWALFEAGHLEEAERVLARAVALSDDDYHLPRNNLQFVRAELAAKRKKDGNRNPSN